MKNSQDYQNSQEFQIHEKLIIHVNRNDFDELGSIIQLKIYQDQHMNSFISSSILISFFDKNQQQLYSNQITILTNSNFTFFDNILFIQLNKQEETTLKILNKEIQYLSIYNSAFYFSNNKKQSDEHFVGKKIIDVDNLSLIDQFSLNCNKFTNYPYGLTFEKRQEKNDNLSLIIKELDIVNRSLIQEKEQVEKSKIILKTREDQINSQIIAFKKEMMLYSDKFYNESYAKINSRVNEILKKLQITENNLVNKCKIIKLKFSSLVNSEGNNFKLVKKDGGNNNITQNELIMNNSGTSNANYREKLANLEIKNKFLEDSLNDLRKKLNDREEFIKNLTENEEKLNRIIKKYKDDNISLSYKIKLLEECLEKKKQIHKSENYDNKGFNNYHLANETDENLKVSKTKKIINKESLPPVKTKLKIRKFGIGKNQISNFTDFFITDLVTSSASNIIGINVLDYFKDCLIERDYSTISEILLNVSIDPIKLFNKFHYAFIYALPKLVKLVISSETTQSKNKKQILDFINEVINSYPDLKKSLLENKNKSNHSNISSLLDLQITTNKDNNINNVSPSSLTVLNLSEILSQKLNNFLTFLEKNEKRFSEKYYHVLINLIIISCQIFMIVLSNEKSQVIPILQNIFKKVLLRKDNTCIDFLISSKYSELLIHIIKSNHFNDFSLTAELYEIVTDSLLYLYSIVDESLNFKNLMEELLANQRFITYLKNILIAGDKKGIFICSMISDKYKHLFEIELNLIKEKNPNFILSDNLMLENYDRIYESINDT